MGISGPNADQIEYWNGQAGPRWVAQTDRLDRQLGPLGTSALNLAGIRTGQNVLDVGCGCGGSTLDLAARVGPTGRVTGVDVSQAMLERARRRLEGGGFEHVSFLDADAQTHRFEAAEVDHLFSRFGVMFFAEPVEAFANLRRALCPGGRCTFVCWSAQQENPWLTEPLAAVGRHVDLPDRAADDEPGPFVFARPGCVEETLSRAGFADAHSTTLRGELLLGGPGTLDAAVEFSLHVGAAASVLADVTGPVRDRAIEELRATLARYTDTEGVCMPFSARMVTAQAS